MAEVVRIVNQGSQPYVDYFNSSKYVIPPGKELLVDFDAMALWLGHPAANNFDPRNRVRVQEYQRLRVRYGVESRSLELSTAGQAVDADQLFKEMRPPLEVFDASGAPIITVADDPEGTFVAPPDPATQPQSDIALIMARLQQTEQEMADLRSELARRDRAENALNEADPIHTDSSGTPPPVGTPPAVPTRSDIPGSIPAPPPDPTSPTQAPRPPARETPGEDSPTRVRVSGA
jgi:hypothetical protein